ncbi:MAG: phosphodiester glycosidase family protein [Muribaculaceae bacterium]|nr:phosphodiester glycosidase family protein [Muribaculaceae bacterium]
MKRLLRPSLMLLLGVALSANAGSINIQGTEYPVDTIQHSKVGPGTIYTKLRIDDATYPLDIHMLKVDLNNQYIRCETLLAKDSIITGEKPTELAVRKSTDKKLYFAGTNADGFRNAPNGKSGYPYTAMVVKGEIATRPIYRSVVAFDLEKTPYFGFVDFKGEVSVNGKSIAINDINADWSEEDLVFFNQLNGKSTHMKGDRTEVLIELLPAEKWLVNTKMAFKVVSVNSDKGNTVINPGQAVLSGIGNAKAFLSSLKAGDTGELDISLPFEGMPASPIIDELSGADRIILSDGEVWDNDWAERHPRTGFGYSADKKTMYYCIVDGRISRSVGVTTKQLVDIMKSAGANSAINFDGGGSSCMYIRGMGQVNNPSDGVERSVPSGMFVSTDAPQDNEIAEIGAIVTRIRIPQFCVYKPTIYGFNKYGILVDTDVKDFTLTCTSDYGTIKDNTSFVALAVGNYEIGCSYNGHTISIPVTIEPLAGIEMRNSSVINDTYLDFKMGVDATLNGNKIPVNPDCISWTADDLSILELDTKNGSFRGIKDGTTNVSGSIGDFSGSMTVIVEKPTARVMPIDPKIDLSTWKISQVGGKNITATPLENGMNLAYTGASGRGPNIKLTKKLKIWSLPDTIRVRINPNGSPVNKITLSIAPSVGALIVCSKDISNLNELTTIDFVVKNICGGEDISNFPLHLNSILLSMNPAEVGKEYSIEIPGIEAVYKAVPSGTGVEQIMSTDKSFKLYPNPVRQGESVIIATENSSDATVVVSNITGQEMIRENFNAADSRISLSTATLTSGIYTISLMQNGVSKTAKLIIK